MYQLNEEINTGQLKQVYLLCGEEDYLRKQYRDRLRAAFLGDGDAMNYHYFEGKDISVTEVIDLAETMPFLSERRVIVLESTMLFKSGGEKLAEYIASPAETVSFIFVEKEIDKRSKLYKAVTAKGRAVEFQALDEKTLKKWVLGMLKKEKKNITERDLEYFLEKTGTSMETISKELEKLFCYCMDRDVITREDIDEICPRQISDQIFAMLDAIIEKRQRDAVNLYYDLLTLKEPAMKILVLLARHFSMLMQVKALKRNGHDIKSIKEIIRQSFSNTRKFISQAGRLPDSVLKQALNDCVEAQEAIVTGKMDEKMSVELLLIRYSV